MNEFAGWLLFITVNCMTPATTPDIYTIKGIHPDFGPFQATVVVCEKTWQPTTPGQQQSETQARLDRQVEPDKEGNNGNLIRY